MEKYITFLTIILILIFSILYLVILNIKDANKDIRNLSFKIISTQLLIATASIMILANIFWPYKIIERNFNLQIFLFILFGIGSVFLIKEISQKNKADETIKNLIKQLSKNNANIQNMAQQKSEFISLASHQLRAPLSNMLGYSSMLLEEEYGELPPKIKGVVERIYKSGILMNTLVNDFLNVSRIEKGYIKYNLERFDLRGLLQEKISNYIETAKEKGIEIKTNLNLDKKVFVKGDVIKSKQIIDNILDNALKYTPRGEVEIKLTEQKGFGLIAVRDTGIGISTEMKNKLFKKFIRSDEAFKIDISGSGLGLYVASSMIKVMGGKIWAISEGKNKGATFFISMPLAKEN